MANGQAKMDLTLRSAPSVSESVTTKSEAELIGYIQQAFAEKNSTLLLLERQHQEQAQALEQLRSEASALLAELHRTQELLEHSWRDRTIASQLAIQQAARIDKLKSLVPKHWEMELSALQRISKDSTEILCWTLKNVYMGNDLLPLLYLETHLNQGEVGVVIKHKVPTNKNSWGESNETKYADEIQVFPENSPINEGRNMEITSLGTSDWAKTKEIVRNLAQLLENSEFKHPSLKKANISGLRTALSNLYKKLTEWPWVFRFDRVELNDTLQTHEYHKLSFRLFNFSVGDFNWTRLDYSIATVDHSGGFGQNPRLEFPESSKDVINNWYAETSDARGCRLELRFAKPNAFDWNVWRKLTNEDHLLIAALVSSLPTQIETIKKQNTHTQDWQKWKELCQSIKLILASQLNGIKNLN